MSRERDRKPDEDFASRWSRMKRGAKAPAAEPVARETPPAEDARSDDEILRELGLPDPETLRPGDDIKGFMAGAVPARIRNRVLRRLWISNPALANLDGLVDYGEDFTDAAMVPAVLQTAYKVGRGWARDVVEDEPGAPSAGRESGEDGQAADATESATAKSEGPEADVREDPAGADPEAGERVAGDDGDERAAEPEAEPVAARSRGNADAAGHRAAPRRMRFRFADD